MSLILSGNAGIIFPSGNGQANAGIITIDGGQDISVFTVGTNEVSITNISTLDSVTGRGNTSTNSIQITNKTASIGTNTGALVVSGGAGIGGDVNIGGGMNIANSIIPANNTVDIGTSTAPIRALYVSSNAINIGGVAISSSNGTISINGSPIITAVTTSSSAISNTATSTSPTTGAFTVAGGAGIAKRYLRWW